MQRSVRSFPFATVVIGLGLTLGACAAQSAPPGEPDDGADGAGDQGGKADSASGSAGSGTFEAGQIRTLIELGSGTLPYLFGKPDLDAEYERVPGANGWEPGASSLSSGNTLRLLVDGDDYRSTLLEKIEAAEWSIWINVFEWQDEGTARQIAEALIAAADRGVDVRVVVDNRHGSGDFKSSPVPGHALVRRMRDAGCEVLAVTYSGYRVNHRKIMVFDGQTAVVTGGNIGGNYLLPLSAGWTYHDAGVLMSGPVVGDVMAVFANSYRRAGGSGLPALPAPEAEEGSFSEAEVQVLWHDGGSDRNIERELVQRIDAAERRVVLINGFGMSADIRDAATRAAGRGVAVTWLWGKASDETALMAQASFAALRRGGVELRRYGHPLHMKAYVADDTLIIGSANLDGFSSWLNDEVALQIHSAEVVEAFMARVVRPDLAASPTLVGDAKTRSGWRDWMIENVLEPIID